jgi:SAM-dependent methyltransferase
MDGASEDGWSAVAEEWAELWGGLADPVRRSVLETTGVRAGSRVLDVGCGSGEFLAMLHASGADAAGVDPAPRMIDIARSLAPHADVRVGDAESLPWPDASFDVVTAFNALQFADDTDEALVELTRVVVPGGFVAIANWAEGARNDLDTVERALAEAAGDEPSPDGDLRTAGGLERLLADGGLELVRAELVAAPWEVRDDDSLVRGVLLGEDAAAMAAARETVIAAARPFRTPDGGYRLLNAFRCAVARVPG